MGDYKMNRKIKGLLIVSLFSVGLWIGQSLTKTEYIILKNNQTQDASKALLDTETVQGVNTIVDSTGVDQTEETTNLELPETTDPNDSTPSSETILTQPNEVVVVHEKPTITLNGDSVLSILSTDEYIELGARAHDEKGNDLDITIIGSINTDCACTQTLSYQATDEYNQTVSIERTVNVSHPNFPSFERFTQDRRTLSQGQTITITIYDDGYSDQDPTLTSLTNVWISLKGNNDDFIDLSLVSKEERSMTFSYSYSNPLPSTQYRFNGVYMSIKHINGVSANVTWDLGFRVE